MKEILPTVLSKCKEGQAAGLQGLRVLGFKFNRETDQRDLNVPKGEIIPAP